MVKEAEVLRSSSVSESLLELIQGIEGRLRELEARRQRLLEEISKLRPGSGTLEYKWVLNKVGKRYYYWYLRVRQGNSLRSIYLGKRVPPELLRGAADKKKLKELQRQLDDVTREIIKLQRKLQRACRALA